MTVALKRATVTLFFPWIRTWMCSTRHHTPSVRGEDGPTKQTWWGCVCHRFCVPTLSRSGEIVGKTSVILPLLTAVILGSLLYVPGDPRPPCHSAPTCVFISATSSKHGNFRREESDRDACCLPKAHIGNTNPWCACASAEARCLRDEDFLFSKKNSKKQSLFRFWFGCKQQAHLPAGLSRRNTENAMEEWVAPHSERETA
jgi:hypothetical protein